MGMSISQSLCTAIESWLSGKATRNLSVLARLSGVSYSTVRRIMQLENEPSMETALKLADIVMSRVERIEFAKVHAPSLAKNIAEVSYKSDDEMLMEYINNSSFVPVILLASHATGTNHEEVRYWFGDDMALRFDELVESGLLSRCDSNWRLDKEIGSVSRSTAREFLRSFCRMAPAANDSINHASLCHVGWESVNPQTAIAIFHLAMNFTREAVKLTSDKSNHGDVLVFFGSFFNVMKGVEVLK
jgi:transcriptional regulator with XRE-family HTH domain